MIGKGKRPRDPNQLAKWIVDQSTSEAPQPEPATAPVPPVNLSEYMAAMRPIRVESAKHYLAVQLKLFQFFVYGRNDLRI